METEYDEAGRVPADARIALCATELEPDVPDWVQLVPSGTFSGMDGRGPYTLDDPDEVITRTRARARDRPLPIDYDHALEAEGHGVPAPAAGWIVAIEARDGELWGRVEWTKAAAERIRAREYRYLSPVFLHDSEGRILALGRAGLTNRPNLALQALHSTHPVQEDEVTHAKMIQLAVVAAALGLPEEADQDEVVARCSTLAGAHASQARVVTALGLAETATTDDVVAAIQSRGEIDPSKYVGIEQYSALADKLRAAQAREGERVVDAAIEAGKLTPAQRGWALSYHAADSEGFGAFIEEQPTIVSGEPGVTGTAPEGSGGELDEAAKAVCAMLELEPEQFTKNVEG